jgi:hypothetical protein
MEDSRDFEFSISPCGITFTSLMPVYRTSLSAKNLVFEHARKSMPTGR